MIRKDIETKVRLPFGNLYRPQSVLLACFNNDGQVAVAGKSNYYPQGIMRLPGGGVEVGETIERASRREALEELTIDPAECGLVEIASKVKIRATATDLKDQGFQTEVYTVACQVNDCHPIAGSDINSLAWLDQRQFRSLVSRMEKLDQKLQRASDGEKFFWADYGRIYGQIHLATLEWFRQKGIWN
jgi:8-oxo-dGTP pyrophosphatase MutT (NUDIX family)